jgi:uncharacterized membrane protein
VSRRPYLDWLRGIAVLIMIEAHTIDSWTRLADRTSSSYQWAVVLAGFGAPIFLFLAGITLMLAAGGRLRKGFAHPEVTRVALRRGAWILALAFLFRLQSFVISGGPFQQSLLKVDILNVMGLAMLAAAVGWGTARTPNQKVLLFTAMTVAATMLTPIIRATGLLDGLPDPIEAYFRPMAGRTAFTLFPWAGFLTAGCVVGALLDAGQSGSDGRLIRWVGLAGIAVGLGGYLASFLPPIYSKTSFWTSSPTFFFLRVGVLLFLVAASYGLSRIWKWEALQEFGRASLFVYWVHVELVYGVLSAPIHKRLSFPVAVAAFVVFALAMFGLVKLKQFLQTGRPTEIGRGGAASFPASHRVPRDSI